MEGYGDYLVAVKCGLGAWQMCPIVWRRCDGRGCGGSRSSWISKSRTTSTSNICGIVVEWLDK